MESALITFTGMELEYPRGSNNDNINNRYLEVALKLSMAKDPKSWSTIPIDARLWRFFFMYLVCIVVAANRNGW